MTKPNNNTPHETNEEWCCACDADVAFMEGRIEDAVNHFALELKARLVAKKDLIDYDLATILKEIDRERKVKS